MNDCAALAAPPVLRRCPRVSVLIPGYNHAAYIGAAIASVLAQDWPEIELRVLDDGSRDTTLAVAEQAVRNPGRVRCVVARQDNAGVSATLNTMMAEADGDAIAILNSDDIFMPDRLSRIMQDVAGRRCFFAFSAVRLIETDAAEDCDEFRAWYEEALERVASLPSIGFTLLQSNLCVSSSNFVFSRDLAERSGGFDPALPLTQDWDFALRCLHLVEPELLREELLQYRVHPLNTWRLHRETSRQQSLAVLRRYFERDAPPENPRAPGQGAWPLSFPTFLSVAAKSYGHLRLHELLHDIGRSGAWPRAPGAPDEAEDRAARMRMLQAAIRASRPMAETTA